MASSDVRPLDARATITVGDVAVALAFWTGVAAFDLDVAMGEPPDFAIVRSGTTHFAIVGTAAPVHPPTAVLYVTVEGLDALLARFDAIGVPLVVPLTEQPWGLRDVVIRCPGDGPLVAFGEPIDR